MTKCWHLWRVGMQLVGMCSMLHQRHLAPGLPNQMRSMKTNVMATISNMVVAVSSVTILLRPMVKVQKVWNHFSKMIGYVTLSVSPNKTHHIICYTEC